jgi:hypothetical protein
VGRFGRAEGAAAMVHPLDRPRPPDAVFPRVAQLAVDLLAERLGDGPAASGPPRELRVAHRLLARESTVGR